MRKDNEDHFKMENHGRSAEGSDSEVLSRLMGRMEWKEMRSSGFHLCRVVWSLRS